MDKQTQAVAEAIEKTLEHDYAGNCGISNLEDVAIAALEASGAEHLGDIINRIKYHASTAINDDNAKANEFCKGYTSAWKEVLDFIALELPPELRGES